MNRLKILPLENSLVNGVANPRIETAKEQNRTMCHERCALNHDATESASIVSGVINKPTTIELCISPVYRRLAVAKFSKSTM